MALDAVEEEDLDDSDESGNGPEIEDAERFEPTIGEEVVYGGTPSAKSIRLLHAKGDIADLDIPLGGPGEASARGPEEQEPSSR